MKQRLTAKDWALIVEALEMLSLDYESEHPEQDLIDILIQFATKRAEFSSKPVSKNTHSA